MSASSILMALLAVGFVVLLGFGVRSIKNGFIQKVAGIVLVAVATSVTYGVVQANKPAPQAPRPYSTYP